VVGRNMWRCCACTSLEELCIWCSLCSQRGQHCQLSQTLRNPPQCSKQSLPLYGTHEFDVELNARIWLSGRISFSLPPEETII
jgi:hypothetical protein